MRKKVETEEFTIYNHKMLSYNCQSSGELRKFLRASCALKLGIIILSTPLKIVNCTTTSRDYISFPKMMSNAYFEVYINMAISKGFDNFPSWALYISITSIAVSYSSLDPQTYTFIHTNIYVYFLNYMVKAAFHWKH